MKRPLLILTAALHALGAWLTPMRADERITPAPVRFEAVDIVIDSGSAPLAAYQFELSAPAGVTIVGVESGEHGAYREAPYYDAAALMGGRIIVGALGEGDQLPTGATRIARLHLRIEGDAKPDYEATLRVAATPDAQRIDQATITVREGTTP